MLQNTALIFGYNDYTFEIEKNIKTHYEFIYIFQLHEKKDMKNIEEHKIYSFDLSENWDDLSASVNIDNCAAFCILEDMAENIFLTISLRETFKNLTIVALSKDKESTDKLMLAGATRILPTTQTTANIIVDMLEKPIVTEVLHNILYEKSDLKIVQIKIDNDKVFNGKYPADIDWSREHGIIVLSVFREDMSSEFIYSSKEKHHVIKSGDIFVVVGYDEDIENFKKMTGNECD